MENNITIGEIIKHYRLQKKLSQEKLAQGICDRKYISHIELGKQIPTLDIVNQLSERLGINLYETYALMLRHHDIETHKKIELLNQYLSIGKRDQLIDLVEQYKELPEFQHGEPFLQLEYAKATYFSWTLKNYEEAIKIAQHALTTIRPFFLDNISTLDNLTNVELCLLNTIAVNYCRLNQKEEGEKYFNFLYEYMTQLFTQSHFATNRNNHFELHFLSTLVYNYFLFYRDSKTLDSSKIDNTISLLKSLHSNYNLPQLLLCKVILLTNCNMSSAISIYQVAHHLGLYLYGPDYQEHIEQSILGDKLSNFITCL